MADSGPGKAAGRRLTTTQTNAKPGRQLCALFAALDAWTDALFDLNRLQVIPQVANPQLYLPSAMPADLMKIRPHTGISLAPCAGIIAAP